MPSLTATQLKDIFKFGLQAIRQTKRAVADTSASSTIWDPESWQDLAITLAASERFKTSTSLQVMCRQMSNAFQEAGTKKNSSTSAASSKRKVDDEEDAPAKKAKRKKVKKSHKHQIEA